MVLLLPIPAANVSKPYTAPANVTVPVPVVVVVSFTRSLRTNAMCHLYAIRMIAADEEKAGNCIVNVPEVAVLSAPKFKTHTAGSPEAVSL